MKQIETKIISGAMYELGQTIKSDDGVANSACNQAALRLDEQAVEIGFLTNKIKKLEMAIKTTINENLDLADGDNCTLINLKNALKT